MVLAFCVPLGCCNVPMRFCSRLSSSADFFAGAAAASEAPSTSANTIRDFISSSLGAPNGRSIQRSEKPGGGAETIHCPLPARFRLYERGVMEQHNWKIQLDGLLKLIAGPLYKDREVFVRELVQNAHDSIRKRIHAEGDTFTPEIRWTADPTTGTLRIRDNGAGLTSGEIHAYLSTVGRSGTGELKHNLHSTAFIG